MVEKDQVLPLPVCQQLALQKRTQQQGQGYYYYLLLLLWVPPTRTKATQNQ